MLTQRQSELLSYITHFQLENGYSPSYAQMADHMNLRSRSGVHRVVSALERRGFIRKRFHQARSIEVTQPAPGPAEVVEVTQAEHIFMKAARAYFRFEGEEGATEKKRCARRAYSAMVHQETKNKNMSVVQ